MKDYSLLALNFGGLYDLKWWQHLAKLPEEPPP
ncbi:MAG: hypothetical protein Ct9H300mP15_29240 [Gemmatimonadota bacterium]|nr:MAG: hypothetical protein Ct9H300mP15_29240 [Gemmatimonadota bacterium]